MKLHDKEFEEYIPHEVIERKITQITNRLLEEKFDKPIVFLSILNGSFMFTAQLLKSYNLPCEVYFFRVTSYSGTSSSGQFKVSADLDSFDLKNKTVIILEDIVDTGNTIELIHSLLKDRQIEDIRVISLLFKPSVYKKKIVIYDYCFSIPDKFVIGYGLDYNQLGRNLPDIYKIKE